MKSVPDQCLPCHRAATCLDYFACESNYGPSLAAHLQATDTLDSNLRLQPKGRLENSCSEFTASLKDCSATFPRQQQIIQE